MTSDQGWVPNFHETCRWRTSGKWKTSSQDFCIKEARNFSNKWTLLIQIVSLAVPSGVSPPNLCHQKITLLLGPLVDHQFFRCAFNKQSHFFLWFHHAYKHFTARVFTANFSCSSKLANFIINIIISRSRIISGEWQGSYGALCLW